MARGLPGRLKIKPDGSFGENKGGVMEGGLGWVSAKSKVAARGARYFFCLEAEFFEDGLFLFEMVNRLDFCFFLLLSFELSLADASTESFDFFVLRRDEEGALVFFFVEGARWAPLELVAEDRSIDCWRRAIVFWRSLVASLTPLAIRDLMTAGSIVGSLSRIMAVSAVAFSVSVDWTYFLRARAFFLGLDGIKLFGPGIDADLFE
jgi:hypothetical protein